jgi:hypothetical protein
LFGGELMGIVMTETYCKTCQRATAHAIIEPEVVGQPHTSICLSCGNKLALEPIIKKES